MLIREHGFDEINGDGERIYITSHLISLMTTNSLAGGNMQAARPSECKKKKKKKAALFTAFKING